MFNYLKSKRDNMLWRYLLPNLCIFPVMIISFMLLYQVDVRSFINLSKITIFCMAFYLIMNAINTRMLSSNLFLSTVSFFYGAINMLQVAHVVFAQFFNIAPASPGMSIKTYFLGRTFFAVAFIILVLLYRHKKEWIPQMTVIASLVLIFLSCWVLTLAPDTVIAFIDGGSFWANVLTIGDKFFMLFALTFGMIYLKPLLHHFPKSHLFIFSCFLGCAFFMETLNLLNFLPFGTTKGPLLPHLFKLTTLYILIIGQVDCCILRPFSNLYIHEFTHNKKMHTALEELYRYSSYVNELELTLATKASSIHQLISIFPEPVLICHQDRILNANQSALNLLGFTDVASLQTTSLWDYIRDSSPEHTHYLESLKLDTNQTFQGEALLTAITGQQYDIEYILTSTSLFDAHSTLCIVRDISAKKLSELTKKHLHEQEFKLSYFSNLSHDLKAPLNIIYSGLQMQQQAKTFEEIHHYTSMMQKNTLKLLRMITNLLDLNKTSQNILTPKTQVFNIVDQFEDICQMSQSYITARGLTYVFDTSIEERLIAIDSELLERIVLNLISNAIKYTPHGGQLFFELTHTDDTVSLHIKDTGIGISADALPHIFERFKMEALSSTALQSYDKSYGMGLSIVKELLTLLGGTISCSSELHKGSEFIITLPTPPIYLDTEEVAVTEFSSLNLKMEFYDI